MQRQVLAMAVVGLVVVTSGCVGVLMGDDLRFEAQSAVIETETASELSYDLVQNNDTTVTRTVEVVGQQRDITVRTWQAVYTRVAVPNVTAAQRAELANASEAERREALGDRAGASAVMVVSTPDAQVLGQSVSPLARLSNRRLIDAFGGQSVGTASGLELVDRSDVTMLGSETNLTVFSGTVQNENGTSTESRVYVAKTPHEGDVVVVIATHPRGLEGAAERIETVVQHIEHPADPVTPSP